jgi:hypothetical protein
VSPWVVPDPGGSFCDVNCAEPTHAQTWWALAAARCITKPDPALIFLRTLAQFDRRPLLVCWTPRGTDFSRLTCRIDAKFGAWRSKDLGWCHAPHRSMK